MRLIHREGQKHGSKKYYQVLLDPHRSKLLADLAEERGMRVTQLMRDWVYANLQKAVPSSAYNEAEAEDTATWRRSIKARVEGRLKSNKEKKEKLEAYEAQQCAMVPEPSTDNCALPSAPSQPSEPIPQRRL